jgi:tRNA(fMet)-specific endonuclease VapC
MRRYLLDSGIAQDCVYRRKGVDQRVREVRKQGNKVGIGLPVLGELWAGVEASTTRERNFDHLRHALAMFVLWPFDKRAAQEYSRVFAHLRRIGRPMQQIDMQIAAIARSLGNCTVVSTDGDLAAIPDLTVENWAVSIPGTPPTA